MPAVLSIGHDVLLLKTRASLLQHAGVDVVSVGPNEAISQLSRKRYALAVLCHSLHSAEAEEIAASVKKACDGCKVLLLSRDAIDGMINGVEVCGAHRPDVLLRSVKRLTNS